MVELSFVRDLVAIIGVIIALTYYLANIRQQKETREANLFNSIYEVMLGKELLDIISELSIIWEYTDYDDFMHKYGPDTNLEAWKRFHRFFTHLEGMGIYVKRGLIRREFIDDFASGTITSQWEKFSPYILERRKDINYPQYYEHVEYLYNQIKPIVEKQHPELKT